MKIMMIIISLLGSSICFGGEWTFQLTEYDFKPIVTFYEVDKSTGFEGSEYLLFAPQIEVGKLDLTDPEKPKFEGDYEKSKKVFYESVTYLQFLVLEYFKKKEK